jgi:hypothetical protein
VDFADAYPLDMYTPIVVYELLPQLDVEVLKAGMREFARSILRAVQSQPVQSVAGLAMTICGVNYDDWLKRLSTEVPSLAQNHLLQLAIILLGVLILAYVFWHQFQVELGQHDRPDIGAVPAFKELMNLSKRSAELVRRRQELLNIPTRYEKDYLTEAGIIEERLRRRLREELHDALRQGRIKSWATPSSGGAERPVEPAEWDNMEMEYSDDEIHAIPWPVGGDLQISAWQRETDPRGKIFCLANIRFSKLNFYREFPLRILPRRIDYVPLRKELHGVEQEGAAI